MKRASAGILAIATSVLPLVAGCAPTGPEGRLALTSRTRQPLRLDASFAHGSYAVDPASVSIIMSTVPLDALRDRRSRRPRSSTSACSGSPGPAAPRSAAMPPTSSSDT